MADEPLHPPVPVSDEQASRILSAVLGEGSRCAALRNLSGGCCYTVLEARPAAGPAMVLKLSHEAEDEGLRREEMVLRLIRERAPGFPVPEPLMYDASGDILPGAYLVLERVPGEHLGDAARGMAPPDVVGLQRDMGRAVAELHKVTRPLFGAVGDAAELDDWPGIMAEKMLDLSREPVVAELLSADTMHTVGRVIDRLPELLAASGEPTLVHGDIWATNIMVDDRRLSGFLDPGGLWAHREYDLAYLEIWGTASDEFFAAYHEAHPPLDGYPLRRMIYWLHTLLIHVWCFRTENYVRQTERVVEELGRCCGASQGGEC